MSEIGEWRPENFAHPGPMELALLALVAFALLRPTRLPWLRVVLLVGLIHMALQHGRHQTLLAMLAPMLLAPAIRPALGQTAPRRLTPASSAIVLAAAAVALVLAGARLAAPIVRHDSASSPIAALAAVPPALRGEPVLNGYGFGGYLIGAGVRPFVDGRADMYGDAFLDLYGKIAAGDPAGARRRADALARRLDDLPAERADRRRHRPRARLAAALRGSVRRRASARGRAGGGRAAPRELRDLVREAGAASIRSARERNQGPARQEISLSPRLFRRQT